ncbi:MAG: hypothetical protein J6M02_07120 [Clostridia bacterium]|nr:hypothetical protein [Clostridia bacterium]
MNNKNLLMVFFGLACLVLLVGVFTASTTLPNGTNKNNGMNPQQINQTLPNTTSPKASNNANMKNAITEQPKDGQLPTEINPNQLGQDISGGVQNSGNAVKDAGNNVKDMIPNMTGR